MPQLLSILRKGTVSIFDEFYLNRVDQIILNAINYHSYSLLERNKYIELLKKISLDKVYKNSLLKN